MTIRSVHKRRSRAGRRDLLQQAICTHTRSRHGAVTWWSTTTRSGRAHKLPYSASTTSKVALCTATFLPLVSYKNVRIIPRYYSNKRRRRDFFSWYTLSSSHRTHMKHQVRSRTTRQFIKYDPTSVTYVFMNRNNEIT